jgi:hypothetical protein
MASYQAARRRDADKQNTPQVNKPCKQSLALSNHQRRYPNDPIQCQNAGKDFRPSESKFCGLNDLAQVIDSYTQVALWLNAKLCPRSTDTG